MSLNSKLPILINLIFHREFEIIYIKLKCKPKGIIGVFVMDVSNTTINNRTLKEPAISILDNPSSTTSRKVGHVAIK